MLWMNADAVYILSVTEKNGSLIKKNVVDAVYISNWVFKNYWINLYYLKEL